MSVETNTDLICIRNAVLFYNLNQPIQHNYIHSTNSYSTHHFSIVSRMSLQSQSIFPNPNLMNRVRVGLKSHSSQFKARKHCISLASLPLPPYKYQQTTRVPAAGSAVLLSKLIFRYTSKNDHFSKILVKEFTINNLKLIFKWCKL